MVWGGIVYARMGSSRAPFLFFLASAPPVGNDHCARVCRGQRRVRPFYPTATISSLLRSVLFAKVPTSLEEDEDVYDTTQVGYTTSGEKSISGTFLSSLELGLVSGLFTRHVRPPLVVGDAG